MSGVCGPLRAQLLGDPCRAYANVSGYTIAMTITASGSSFDNTYRHTLNRTAHSSIILDHLRSESTILGPNGEVYEVVYEGRSTSNATVDDKNFLPANGGYKLTLQTEGSGNISPSYDSTYNSDIVFQPGLNGACTAILTMPTVIDATTTQGSNGSWSSLTLPYGWGPGNLSVPLGQTTILPGGVQTLFFDPLPSVSDPSAVPMAYDRALTVRGLGGNGALVDWNMQWHVEPITACDCQCNLARPAPGAKAAGAPSGSPPVISGPHEVWWFNGEQPPGFMTQIRLDASPKRDCTYEWTIVSGSNRVAFAGPANKPSVELVSTSYSQTSEDVNIQVKVNGVASKQYPITVRAPFSLKRLSIDNVQESNPTGYATYICYLLLDNLKQPVGPPVPVSEYWPVPKQLNKDFPSASSDWWMATQSDGKLGDGPPPAQGGTDPGGKFCDGISSPGVVNGKTVPAPGYRPITQVHHDGIASWGQTIFVGSSITGHGVPVQTDTLHLYQDHADHENVVSPVLGFTPPGGQVRRGQ